MSKMKEKFDAELKQKVAEFKEQQDDDVEKP